MDLRLRKAADADLALLERVYRSTRAEELALTSWDEAQRVAFVRMQFAAQRTHYLHHYPDSVESVIEARKGTAWRAAGRLWRDDSTAAIHVLDIALLAKWRRQGLGGQLLRALLAEAAASGREVSIHVETGNPARSLYERLGFQPDGKPEGIYQRMVWRNDALVLMECTDEQA